MLKRLSHEANDAIDEFLELAFSFEQREPPSLQGFVAWLRAADTEVKRDMEIGRNEVRVMTVHGAKGLEAPVVFLMDTTSSPTDAPRLNLVKLPLSPLPALAGRGSPTAECVVWTGRKADDCAAVETARGKMIANIEDEYRRLLYVAMTRAAERLVIGGVMPGNRGKPRDDWWYQLVTKGLEGAELTKQEFETPAGKVTRFIRPDDALAPVSRHQPRGPAPRARLAAPAGCPECGLRSSAHPAARLCAPAKWSAALAGAAALQRGAGAPRRRRAGYRRRRRRRPRFWSRARRRVDGRGLRRWPAR